MQVKCHNFQSRWQNVQHFVAITHYWASQVKLSTKSAFIYSNTTVFLFFVFGSQENNLLKQGKLNWLFHGVLDKLSYLNNFNI